MGSVVERRLKNGKKTYRMRIRKKNVTLLDLTFDDRDAALKWLDDNEDEVLYNPEKFLKLRHHLFYDMQKLKLSQVNHIRKPKPPKK